MATNEGIEREESASFTHALCRLSLPSSSLIDSSPSALSLSSSSPSPSLDPEQDNSLDHPRLQRHVLRLQPPRQHHRFILRGGLRVEDAGRDFAVAGDVTWGGCAEVRREAGRVVEERAARLGRGGVDVRASRRDGGDGRDGGKHWTVSRPISERRGPVASCSPSRSLSARLPRSKKRK